MSKHFEVTVTGQYHAMSSVSGTPTLKNYKETFILPSQESALSSICKHLLAPRLKKSHSDFIRYRTHELVLIILKGYTPNSDVPQMDIMDMNILELHDFCILRQLTIDPYKHAKEDIFQIRTSVAQAYSNKRQAAKDMKESKNAIDISEAETLRKINDLDTPTGTNININEQKVTAQAQTQKPNPPPNPSDIVDPADEPLPAEELDPVLE